MEKNIDEIKISEENERSVSKSDSSEKSELSSSSTSSSNNNVVDDSKIKIDQETQNILTSIHSMSNNTLILSQVLLYKLLNVQEEIEKETQSDSNNGIDFPNIDEFYENINKYSENAEYVLKDYKTFYDEENKTINIEEVTFLAQIWTGDMYNSDGIEALEQLIRELQRDNVDLRQIEQNDLMRI